MRINTEMTVRKSMIPIFLLLIFINSFSFAEQKFEACISTGFGLPKIPVSQYRPPVSLLAGMDMSALLSNKIGLQAGAYALKTFSLGTVNDAPDLLIFDVYWASLALMYQLRGMMEDDRTALLIGGGYYNIDQRFKIRRDKLSTPGFNLGLSHVTRHKKYTGKFEIRWHLLFEPGDNPQWATVTYGFCF